MTDPFEILGLAPDLMHLPNWDRLLKNAYRNMCKKYHPDTHDRSLDAEEAARMFVLVKDAFDTLNEPDKYEHWKETGAMGGLTQEEVQKANLIRNTVKSMLKDLMEQNVPLDGDVNAMLLSFLHNGTQTLYQQKGDTLRQISRGRTLSKKYQRKKNTAKSPLHEVLKENIAELEGKLTQLEGAIKCQIIVKEFLEEYGYDFEPVMPGFTTQIPVYTSTMTRF